MKIYSEKSFVETKSAALHPILQAWVALQRKYSQALNHRDHTWNYGERASIGILAASAWRCGGVALEEWLTKKKTGNGRCDLWIRHKGQDLSIEAKYDYVPAMSPTLLSRIERKLKHATMDAGKLKCPSSRNLAIVFLIPTFPRSERRNLARHIPQFLHRVRKIRHSAIAWFRLPFEHLQAVDNWSAPGILLLARFARS